MIALDHACIPSRASGWLTLSRSGGVLRYESLRAPREDNAVRWPVKGSRAAVVRAQNVLSATGWLEEIAAADNVRIAPLALRAARLLRSLGVCREG